MDFPDLLPSAAEMIDVDVNTEADSASLNRFLRPALCFNHSLHLVLTSRAEAERVSVLPRNLLPSDGSLITSELNLMASTVDFFQMRLQSYCTNDVQEYW